MRVRRNTGRIGKVIFIRDEYSVRPVTYRDYEEFNIYDGNRLIATLDTLGAAIDFIKNEIRSN